METSTSQLIDLQTNETIELEILLKRYLGQVVVLDFGASWCAPCIESFPYTKEIEKNLGIVFLYISIDKNINQWKACVEDHKLPVERSFFLKNGIHSPFAKKFTIESIPRYFIYDKSGSLIDQNASSPLRGELQKQLSLLLH